ncbi:probable E3 ubiquitin-protein ligase bre1 isoform X3 [Chrysoperla carnea]|uniref:probable E3 ubiquitin-protein ligase bre1 isoform X3 n=1 Tax=Chrysoperla carnea TaxID=189513 RepID=UPI001D088379|nr:probable E3 ubiquitin-protein ligase bre1 isoform X3 [Chrysoperla carnea]
MKPKKKGKRSWKNDKTSSESSSSDSDTNLEKPTEHDLTDYAGNSIKLMTEIFKVLGDKKLKTMVPNILKPIDMNDLKACLVEESMALSKKRLISILNGETYSSSSSDSEDEVIESKKPPKNDDIISLDGISDDSDIFYFDELPEAEVLTEIKKENNKKTAKKHKKSHKQDKVVEKKKIPDKPLSVAEEKAMTALELLELQARARAIKSQLALESVTSPIDNVDEEIKTDNNDLKAEGELKEKEQPKTRKVKLRRDHLRIDPNRTNNQPNSKPKSPSPVKEKKPSESEIKDIIETTEIKRERRSSTDSLIVESPSHPLIVLSSDDEGKNTEKTSESLHVTEPTDFTEVEKNLVNDIHTEKSTSEEGEISSENESTVKASKKVDKNQTNEKTANKLNENQANGKTGDKSNKNDSKTEDQDFIIIDCEERDLESDTEEVSEGKLKDGQNVDTATWKSRWLDSRKVKTVLQTSKLCNNMKRKISLKKDQQASPKSQTAVEESVESVDSTPQKEEGSIDQFNTLSISKKIEEVKENEINQKDKTEQKSKTDYLEIVSDSDEK